MTAFNIRAAISAVVDETDLASPDEIAVKVAEMIPRDQLRAVLALTLREFVRGELGRLRMSEPPAATAKANASAKVRAIRDAAPRWLRERVFAGEWKLLGDCTGGDLAFLEASLREHASRSSAKADMYRRLAGLVKRHKVSRVADLPAAVLADDAWRAAA